jgi:hypothetical protein
MNREPDVGYWFDEQDHPLEADLQIESSGVELKGIAGEVRVHRLRGAPRGRPPVDA